MCVFITVWLCVLVCVREVCMAVYGMIYVSGCEAKPLYLHYLNPDDDQNWFIVRLLGF